MINISGMIYLSLLFFGVFISPEISAQVNEEAAAHNVVTFHFPVNQLRLRDDFSDNAGAFIVLNDILNICLPQDIDSIVIRGHASPDGIISHNIWLSSGRAQRLRSYVLQHYPQIERNKIIARGEPFNWSAIRDILIHDSSVPFREEAMAILSSKQVSDVRKLTQLKSVGNGALLRYISQRYSVSLRNVICDVYCKHPVIVQRPCLMAETEDMAPKSDTVNLSKKKRKSSVASNNNYKRIKKPLLAVKTNLLFDMVSALNIEVEVPVGNRWSVLGEYTFPWWLWEHKQYCLQVINANIEGRYWFGNRTGLPVLAGWFAGFYAGGGYYDIEWGNKGYQGEFYMSGLSGGYAHVLGKYSNLRVEYSLGLGYLHTRYQHYVPVAGIDDRWHLVQQQSGHYGWIGPARLKVSLAWILHYSTNKSKNNFQ